MLRRWKSAFFITLGVGLLAAVCRPEDWPEWRGPNRDGVLPSTVELGSWPERLKLKWRVTIGEGHASPIYAAGKIFVFSRQNEQESVSSIDPGTGKAVWQQTYAAPYKMNPAAVRHGKGPKSTPLFYNGSIYTLGINGTLSCFDAGKGSLRWRKDFQFKESSPLFGTAMSPMIDENLLIAHVGGNNDGALSAFDAGSGEMKWSWKGDGPGYASPVAVVLDGARQVVTQTQQNIVGVSAKSGELLWRIPFTTPYVQNIVTPLIYGQTLILSGLSNGTMGVRVWKKGNRWSTEKLWDNQEVSMYMSSPVLSGDLVFGFSHRNKGQFFCLDARTGSTKWLGEPRQGENAAMLIERDNLLILKDDAELIVAKASGKGFEPLRRYTVADSPTWAHPLVLNKGVVIKDATALAFWSLD